MIQAADNIRACIENAPSLILLLPIIAGVAAMEMFAADTVMVRTARFYHRHISPL